MNYEQLSEGAKALIQNPHWIEEELAKRSLHDFVRLMWHAVEANRPFVDNWSIGVVCERLEAVNRGEIKRLLINVPPRSMKSLTCDVFWPAWTWIQDPDKEFPLLGPSVAFLYATYSNDLTIRDSVKCREVIQSDKFKELWGDRVQLSSDQNLKHRFKNTEGGERLSTSVEGKLTGEGGDICVSDDPHNTVQVESDPVREHTVNWWRQAMSNRLNNPAYGAHLIVMQRQHEMDLSGFVIEEGGFEHVCLPSKYEEDHPFPCVYDMRKKEGELLWPSRLTEEFLEKQENELGSYGFAGQHQQRPSPRKGGMFQTENWRYVNRIPQKGRVAVRAWDLAGTEEAKGKDVRAAYTVGGLMSRVENRYFIEDIQRFRGTPAQVRARMKATAEADGPKVIIDFPQDPAQAGKDQAQSIVSMLAPYIARYSLESGDKVLRAEGMSAQQEVGNVYLLRAPWNDKFVAEAALFPNGRYKDQVDAASRAFHRLARKRGVGLATHAPEVVDTSPADE